MLRLVLHGALGAACLTPIAAAQAGVNVDLLDVPGVALVPSSAYGAAAQSPGEWNVVDPGLSVGGTIMTGPLIDTSGATSTISLTCDGFGVDPLGLYTNEPNTFGDDDALLDDGLYYDGPATLTFTGVPAGNYLVYTYAMAPDDPLAETSVQVTGSPDPLQIVGGDFSSGFVQGDTHAVHAVTVGAAGTVEIMTDIATTFDTLSGLQLVPAGGPVTLGTNYCTAQPNSTGSAAAISATGSATAADNDVTLHATGVPPMQFGIFITSETQAATPLASGTLCVGGNIVRFQGPGQIRQADANGEYSLQIDTTALPAGVPTPILPGETWNFTTWFRDLDPMVGNTANFSDGVSIDFL